MFSTTLSLTGFRQKLREVIEKACADHAPILVTRQNGEDIVVMPRSYFEELDETAHLLQSPANARRLMEAMRRDPSEQQVFGDIDELKDATGL